MRIAVFVLVLLSCCSQELTSNQLIATVQLEKEHLLSYASVDAKVIAIRLGKMLMQSGVGNGECFGKSMMEISNGQIFTVQATRPFTLFLTSKLALQYYNLQQTYGSFLQDLSLNSIVNADKKERAYVASTRINLKCSYTTHPYFQLGLYAHIDFYQDGKEEKKRFDVLLVCANQQQIKAFTRFYEPCYVIFWLYFNLALMIYHAYNRTRFHLSIFLFFLLNSLLITQTFTAYCALGILFFFLVLQQRKQSNINTKTFSLYLFFMLFVIMQCIYAYQTSASKQVWNGFWIAVDNFVVMHMGMFVILRTIKLNRFRHVFWYFVGISILSILLQDSHNYFFHLIFKNPLNLNCMKANLFFPMMMLPISNFYTSITNWMHRIINIALLVSAVVPLSFGIKLMSITLVVIMFGEIRVKGLQVVSHTI